MSKSESRDGEEPITAAEMRALEHAAIQSGQVTGLALMERAGHGVVDATLQHWPDLDPEETRFYVLCGPGNNGGDGFVVARLLKQRGWNVVVHPYGWDILLRPGVSPPNPTGDAWINAQAWRDMGGVSRAGHRLDLSTDTITYVVIDALLGIGQTRASDNLTREFWAAWDLSSNISASNIIHCVSIDIPTGYNSDTGELLGTAPFAPDLTITFHRPKPIHLIRDTPCGTTVITDIGL